MTIIYEFICDVVSTLKNRILCAGGKGKTHWGINPNILVRTNGNEKPSTDLRSDKRSRDRVRAADAYRRCVSSCLLLTFCFRPPRLLSSCNAGTCCGAEPAGHRSRCGGGNQGDSLRCGFKTLMRDSPDPAERMRRHSLSRKRCLDFDSRFNSCSFRKLTRPLPVVSTSSCCG